MEEIHKYLKNQPNDKLFFLLKESEKRAFRKDSIIKKIIDEYFESKQLFNISLLILRNEIMKELIARMNENINLIIK